MQVAQLVCVPRGVWSVVSCSCKADRQMGFSPAGAQHPPCKLSDRLVVSCCEKRSNGSRYQGSTRYYTTIQLSVSSNVSRVHCLSSSSASIIDLIS